jgi:hypothetical protein
VLDEVLAHMLVQNEPRSEETVNALQVFSTFQRREICRDVSRELKSAWSREDPKIKKGILQCKQQTTKQGAKKNA